MKIIFINIILILSCLFSVAQNDTIIKYYDSIYAETSERNASFIQKTYKKDGFFICNQFFYPSMKLKHESKNKDSILSKKVGVSNDYYENGQLKSTYNADLKLYFSFYESGKKEAETIPKSTNSNSVLKHYYESGKLMAEVEYDENDNEKVAKGFDENGIEIPNYVYQREAEFTGGRQGWANFLMKTLNPDVPTRKKAPVGRYSVLISFLVNKDGSISEIKALNNPGYGTMEEAIRVMKKSPKWQPGVQFNKIVLYRARQPITFVVSDN
ncbi:MAG: energy transducer TonB [Chitinophagaceae bacterium]